MHHAFSFPSCEASKPLKHSIKHTFPYTSTQFEEPVGNQSNPQNPQKLSTSPLKSYPGAIAWFSQFMPFFFPSAPPPLSKTDANQTRTLAWTRRKLTSFSSPSITVEGTGRRETNDQQFLHHSAAAVASSSTTSSSTQHQHYRYRRSKAGINHGRPASLTRQRPATLRRTTRSTQAFLLPLLRGRGSSRHSASCLLLLLLASTSSSSFRR